jgi:hypothetical protein
LVVLLSLSKKKQTKKNSSSPEGCAVAVHATFVQIENPIGSKEKQKQNKKKKKTKKEEEERNFFKTFKQNEPSKLKCRTWRHLVTSCVSLFFGHMQCVCVLLSLCRNPISSDLFWSFPLGGNNFEKNAYLNVDASLVNFSPSLEKNKIP